MNVLIQLHESIESQPNIESCRLLDLFCLHECLYSKEKRIFIHYLLAVGYGGGGVQEEAFYKIEGSKIGTAEIYITTNCGGSDYEKIIGKNNPIEPKLNLTKIDTEIQAEFHKKMNHYLRYSEDLGCYLYKRESGYVERGYFNATFKFPTALLKNLKTIFWPFSISF